MRLFHYTLLSSFFLSLIISDAEVLRRLDGSLIKISDDGTWKPIKDDQSGANKIVFTIAYAKESQFDEPGILKIQEDNFGNAKGYEYLYSIKFGIEVRNNTKFDAIINCIEIRSEKIPKFSYAETEKILKRRIAAGEFYLVEGIALSWRKKSKKQMTEEQYKAKFETYSLENLGDTFYVSNGNQFTGNGQLIEFDPKAKIPKHAVADYTYGNERGVLPLKETVEVDYK